MTTFNQIQETIAATLNISPSLIKEDTKDTDVTAWDSLGHVNIMMSLEQTFDVFLEVEDFAELKSVPAIVDYLRGQGLA
jgi:acyl carrier protein